VASLGGSAPGDTIQGGDTRSKLFFVTEFTKNTEHTMSEGGSGDETRGKKGHQFADGDD